MAARSLAQARSPQAHAILTMTRRARGLSRRCLFAHETIHVQGRASRLVACLFDPDQVKAERIGFENT